MAALTPLAKRANVGALGAAPSMPTPASTSVCWESTCIMSSAISHTHTHTNTDGHTHTRSHTHTVTHAHGHTHTYAHSHHLCVCACVCVCVCVYVCVRAFNGRAHDTCQLPANTRARGRGHGRSRTQRPDVCPLCQRCQCSHYGIEARRDRRGSYTPEVLLTPLGLPRPVRPLGLLGFSAIVALVRLFGNGYAFDTKD